MRVHYISILALSLTLSLGALGLVSCGGEPDACDEAAAYLKQCQTNMDSCDEGQLEHLLSLNCPANSLAGKAELAPTDEGPTTWSDSSPALCR